MTCGGTGTDGAAADPRSTLCGPTASKLPVTFGELNSTAPLIPPHTPLQGQPGPALASRPHPSACAPPARPQRAGLWGAKGVSLGSNSRSSHWLGRRELATGRSTQQVSAGSGEPRRKQPLLELLSFCIQAVNSVSVPLLDRGQLLFLELWHSELAMPSPSSSQDNAGRLCTHSTKKETEGESGSELAPLLRLGCLSCLTVLLLQQDS